MGMALAIVQGRNEAVALSEQLSEASQVLTETQAALAETKVQALVGEMAGGAAHEINNPLAVISGRAQLMRDSAQSEQERKTWALIADQAERISETITELMEFASPPVPRPGAFDLTETLRGAAKAFAKSDHPQAASARVDIDTGADLPPVWADKQQVCTVVEELIANAAGVSPGESPIRISARIDETAGAVILSVSDSGPGMDEETALRAFTPFFSQQKAGRRRGLGLARAKRWIENNGGAIWIDTRRGEGTTVYVELPSGK
jgi:signal transduction histidine kinase